MKKNYFNFFFLLTVFSIGGLLLIIALQSAFGIVPVFIVSSILVFVCGIAIIPLQIKQAKDKRLRKEYFDNLDKFERINDMIKRNRYRNRNKSKHKQDLGYYKRHNLP